MALAGCAPTQGESMRILVGGGAGSAGDGFARILVRYFEGLGVRGSVENQPTAGGKLAAQRLARAAPDEDLMAVLPTGLIYSALLEEDGVDFDLSAFGWLGSFGRDRRVLAVTGRSGAAGFASLATRERPLVLAATAAASPGFYEPRIISHLTGARLNVVPGYIGGSRNMALVSGEADGLVASIDGLEQVLALPGARVLLRLNDLELPPGTLGDAAAAPALRTFAGGPDAPALLNLINVHADFGRIIALPAGAPPERLSLWRRRIAGILADPAFLKEASERGYAIEPTPGELVSERMTALLSTRSAETRAALARAFAGP
jgi:tripartite-type tricarboxylate transporter receptor subunit TctC